MAEIKKIRIPAVKVITISDDLAIHINDQIFGKLVIKLLNDEGSCIDGCEIQMLGYSGESGFFVTVPKKWLNKKVLVSYEREVNGEMITSSSSSWFKEMPYFASTGSINIGELTIDYPKDGDVSYSIFVME